MALASDQPLLKLVKSAHQPMWADDSEERRRILKGIISGKDYKSSIDSH